MAQIFSVVRVAMEALRDLCGSEVKASDSGAEGPEFVSRLWKARLEGQHFLPHRLFCHSMGEGGRHSALLACGKDMQANAPLILWVHPY